MVTLDLRQLFVTLVATGESVSAPHLPLPVRTTTKTGERREFAGGRRRGISTAGTSTDFPVTLLRLTKAQVDTLESWTGQTVLVRDWRGQGIWGVYWKVTTVAQRPPNMYASSITVESLTVDEGV